MTEADESGVRTESDDEALPAQAGELSFISYADFGQRFFEVAVTRERVVEAVAGLAGRPVEFGPIGVGPIRLVKVRASGAVGEPTVVRCEGEQVAFALTIPVDLQLVIEIGLDKYRFTAAVRVRVAITARAAEPLQVVIDIEPPTTRTIDVDLQAEELRASVLQLVGGVEGELKRSVAKIVSKEIEKPEIQSARVIDVAKALNALSLGR